MKECETCKWREVRKEYWATRIMTFILCAIFILQGWFWSWGSLVSKDGLGMFGFWTTLIFFGLGCSWVASGAAMDIGR